jgi:hypothetical protein
MCSEMFQGESNKLSVSFHITDDTDVVMKPASHSQIRNRHPVLHRYKLYYTTFNVS